ncbi:MAG: UvrD-helicase domain-containing protein, partial [Verrucomicrobiae bacterium]|nr:UvrD-helicase domain-containing protein [Verrucomicrobiae bacterium]
AIDWERDECAAEARAFEIVAEAKAIRLEPAALDGTETSHPKAKETRAAYLQAFEKFCRDWKAGADIGMLAAADQGGGKLKQASADALAPVHDWYVRSLWKIGATFAEGFQKYRRSAGRLTFQDQILLCGQLLSDGPVREALEARRFHVILDEAQDTTPRQFAILAALTRDADQEGSDSGPGRWVMVGDPQQSIYLSMGSDLEKYLSHHASLGGDLKFQETHRCSRSIVEFVNARFPEILHGREGQASFVELVAKSGAQHGCVSRLKLPRAPEGLKTSEAAQWEADRLAERIAALGKPGLGVSDWSQVAILMPRNDWLHTLAVSLGRSGVPCRVTARRNFQDELPYRWAAALLAILSRVDDEYETSGVLREIFGVPDAELAEFRLRGGSFSLRPRSDRSHRPEPSGALGEALELLRGLRHSLGSKLAAQALEELFSATRLQERLAEAANHAPEFGPVSRIERGLEWLRGAAAQAELKGMRWEDWAEELFSKRGAPMPELPAGESDAVVLMTCQKAKGLEWDLVILPMLGRPLQSGSDREPIETRMAGDDVALRHAGFKTLNWDAANAAYDAKSRAEWGRIYYVACTRARSGLVLVDARDLWSKTKKKNSKRPTAFRVLSAEGSSDWMDELEEPSRARATSAPPAGTRVPAWKLPGIAGPWPVVRVRRPSQQDAELEEPGLPVRRRVEPLHGAVVYGTWWHELM